MEYEKIIDITMKAMEKLLKMFILERYLYLLLTVIVFIMLIMLSYKFFISGNLSTEDNKTLLNMFFGGSGIVALASFRVTLFFNKAFSLLREVVFAERNND